MKRAEEAVLLTLSEFLVYNIVTKFPKKQNKGEHTRQSNEKKLILSF